MLTSRQPHRVTSGRITHLTFVNTSSIHQYSNHRWRACSLFSTQRQTKPSQNSRYKALFTTDGSIFKKVHYTDLLEDNLRNHKYVCPSHFTIPSNTCFGAFSYSAGIQHGNLHLSRVVMSRVTCFILQTRTAACISHHWRKEKLGRDFGTNEGEWTGEVESRQEKVPGSRVGIHGHILTYPRRERENL